MLTSPHPIIALLGNPNSGKTTFFNAVTGRKKAVGNWSGVTVTAQRGIATLEGHPFEIVDLPGTYSLTIVEDDVVHDEAVPASFLKSGPYTFVINVVDATALERHLYLTLQALEQQIPMVLVINRSDALSHQGKVLDVTALTHALGCPVILQGPTKGDQKQYQKALVSFVTAETPIEPTAYVRMTYPAVVEQQLAQLAHTVGGSDFPRWQLLRWLEGEKPQDPRMQLRIRAAQSAIEAALAQPADVIIAQTRYDFIERSLKTAMTSHATHTDARAPSASFSDTVDSFVCHRFWGLPCFFGMMYALFFFAIVIGGAFQGMFESLAHLIWIDGVGAALTAVSAPQWLQVLLVSGIGQAMTTLMTFIPVIGAMFLALSFLEESGYMARAAFVMDKLMRAVGLPGKSFVPMIVGFGCNVPAILGTRTLDNRRDRILAVMMSPFMSCGARLAIFTVFVAAFFPTGGQNIVFLLYFIGIAMAILTGLLLKKTLLRGANAPFLLEMPRYQWPSIRRLGRTAWHRLNRFLINAGKLIIPVCMVIGLSNQITLEGRWVDESESSQSILSMIGQQMVPVFKPMGIEEDNWPAAVGLLTGLMAKEVVIGTLNALYTAPAMASVAAPVADPTAAPHAYGEMVKRFHGQANAFAYLLFVLLYFPCMSATAAMLREVQKGWTLFSVCWTTGLAYGLAVGFYQCATFMAHPLQSSLWLGALGLVGWGTWYGIRHYSRVYLWHKLPTRIVVRT